MSRVIDSEFLGLSRQRSRVRARWACRTMMVKLRHKQLAETILQEQESYKDFGGQFGAACKNNHSQIKALGQFSQSYH
jgi:hypothetical protein